MKKIPTIFERDLRKQPALLTPEPNLACLWVFHGEGYPTRKFDGTCVMIRDGKLYARREVKPTQSAPPDFEEVDHDHTTGKRMGWVPVTDDPHWKWHLAAYEGHIQAGLNAPGTYELCGPHFERNPEGFSVDMLVAHGLEVPNMTVKRTYEGLKDALVKLNWEGFVFYHQDGRRAKIKLKDFGIKRKPPH